MIGRLTSNICIIKFDIDKVSEEFDFIWFF